MTENKSANQPQEIDLLDLLKKMTVWGLKCLYFAPTFGVTTAKFLLKKWYMLIIVAILLIAKNYTSYNNVIDKYKYTFVAQINTANGKDVLRLIKQAEGNPNVTVANTTLSSISAGLTYDTIRLSFFNHKLNNALFTDRSAKYIYEPRANVRFQSTVEIQQNAVENALNQ